MGTFYELKCTGCGYQYEGAGGQEAGFLGVLETKSCGSCRRLVDVLAWSVEDPEAGPELVCPECGGSELREWDPKQAPCPKCGQPLTRTSIGIFD